MKLLNRKQLPLTFKIRLKFNLPDLIEEFRQIGALNINNYNDFNYSLESPIQDLLSSNFEVRKLALTSSDRSGYDCLDDMNSFGYRQYYFTESKMRKKKQNKTTKGLSAKDRLRRLDRESVFYEQDADERNYSLLRSNVGEELKNIIDQFGEPTCRIRLAALAPNCKIKPHIDYDPTYLVRYHIPLITNSRAEVCFNHKGKIENYHLMADGSVYFLNSGISHWVQNYGDEHRVHLLIDVNGQRLLQNQMNKNFK